MEGGGAQRDAILLANAMAKRGWRVSIPTLQPEGPLCELVDRAVEVVALPAGSLKMAIPAFRQAFARLGPDAVVLSSEAAQNAVAALAHATLPRTRCPKLLLREVAAPSIARASDPYVQNRLAYRVLGHAYRHCDRVLTLTDGARADLIANFAVPPERIDVMRANAVLDEASQARLLGTDMAAGREPDLIVCLGRLSVEKDQLTLIEAFARVLAKRPARLVLVGDGPLRGDIEQMAAALGVAHSLTLTGFQTDPFFWLKRAELAVCSSRFEGFGNAIVEALACGTPVVSTDCPFGPREILGHGLYGRLVAVGNPSAMADALIEELGKHPDRARLRARAWQFTGEAAAIELERIIAGLAPH